MSGLIPGTWQSSQGHRHTPRAYGTRRAVTRVMRDTARWQEARSVLPEAGRSGQRGLTEQKAAERELGRKTAIKTGPGISCSVRAASDLSSPAPLSGEEGAPRRRATTSGCPPAPSTPPARSSKSAGAEDA